MKSLLPPESVAWSNAVKVPSEQKPWVMDPFRKYEYFENSKDILTKDKHRPRQGKDAQFQKRFVLTEKEILWSSVQPK